MALPVSLSSVLRSIPRLRAVVVCVKNNRGSEVRSSWTKKRPRKKYSPRPYEKGDISVLYSEKVVVESTPDLVKASNEHINDYVDDHDLSGAQELFNLMLLKGVEPDTVTYNTLMKGYSRVGNTKRVLELFKEMEENCLIPSIVTFNTAIRSFGSNGDLEGAQSFFKKMKDGYELDPDAYTYSSLLNVCVNARDLKAAKRLFDEMSFSDTKQNRIAMNTIIDVYAECSNKKNGKQYLEECRELMEDMESKGIEADKHTYNTMLKLCAKGTLTDDAMKVLNEMKGSRIRPDVFSYSTVLNGISKDQELSNEEVLELSSRVVNDMKRDGVCLNATSLTSLINVALRVGDLCRGNRLFKEMERLKVDPTNVTYGAMIKCYEKLGDPKDGEAYLKPCLDLWQECEQAGMNLTEEGYTALLSACANASDLSQASNVWDKMVADKVTPNVFHYTAMINACLSNDKENNAFRLLDQMKASGIKPNVVTYGTILSFFVRKKDRAGAERILAEMKILGIVPDKPILRTLKLLGIE